MIDTNKIKQVFNQKYPKRNIRSIHEYDKNNLLVIAPEVEGDEADPNFLINKSNGSIRQINPTEDLDAFVSAIKKEIK